MVHSNIESFIGGAGSHRLGQNAKEKPHYTDYDLIQTILKAQVKDQKEFEKLFKELIYNKYLSFVSTQCTKILPEKDRPDAVQNIFIKIFEKLEYFKGESSLKTWIFTITRRMCLNILNKNNRTLAKSLEQEFEFFLPHKTNEVDSAVNNTKVMEKLEEILEDVLNNLNSDVDTLNKRNKAMIIDRFEQGTPYSELALIYSMSEASAKTTFSRFKSKLLDRLEKEGYEVSSWKRSLKAD